MIDFSMGVFLGYFVCKTLEIIRTVSKKPDRILSWNSDIMAYRSVPDSARVKPGETYLVCYEIKVPEND